jgi:hypothetical protein
MVQLWCKSSHFSCQNHQKEQHKSSAVRIQQTRPGGCLIQSGYGKCYACSQLHNSFSVYLYITVSCTTLCSIKFIKSYSLQNFCYMF